MRRANYRSPPNPSSQKPNRLFLEQLKAQGNRLGKAAMAQAMGSGPDPG